MLSAADVIGALRVKMSIYSKEMWYLSLYLLSQTMSDFESHLQLLNRIVKNNITCEKHEAQRLHSKYTGKTYIHLQAKLQLFCISIKCMVLMKSTDKHADLSLKC